MSVILKKIENRIVDRMSLKQVRYLHPVPADKATGKLADIYQQVRRDFQLVPPITLFSKAPDLLGGLWSISREAQNALTNGLPHPFPPEKPYESRPLHNCADYY